MRLRALLAALLLVSAATAVTAYAGSNAVPDTSLGRTVSATGPNDVKPSACSPVVVTAIVTGAGATNAAELMLGTASADSINARGGDDCVHGGGGDDSIQGGSGYDVCIGGPGNDTFSGCEVVVQ